MDRVRELVTAIPAAVAQAAAEVREEGLDHEIVDRLEVLIGEHAEACVRVLG
jgi:hypothetical protein